MTEEEMAEEYLDEKCKDCYMCSYSEHKNPYKICQRRKDRKQAFLAGLKAGRPQWHKVADELPKEDDIYLIYTTEGYLLGHYEQGGADGKIDFCGEPYSDFTEYPSEEELMENDVIAWCEIPTFDKEK